MSTLDKDRTVPDSIRFRLLWEAGRELGDVVTPGQVEQAYQTIVRKISTVTFGFASIRIFDSLREKLTLKAAHGPAQESELVVTNEGLDDRVTSDLETIHLGNSANPMENSANLRSLIVTPIQFKDKCYGTLSVSAGRADAFSAEDVKVVEGLALQLGITIHRLELLRAQEEAEQRANDLGLMSLLGQSAMEMAHRVGNEFGLVLSYVHRAQALLDASGVEDNTIKNLLNRISDCSETIRNLGRELRDSSAKLERKESRVVSIESLVKEVSSSNLPQEIHINHEIQEGLPPVNISPGQVVDILRNLFDNAVEAMPNGGTVTIRVSQEREQMDHSPENIVIEVIDTGPGIPPYAEDKIFKLFFSTKGSSGFGLWSAREYARANGGDLTYEQRSNEGATFVLRLPIAAKGEARRDVNGSCETSLKQILHVEDDERWSTIIREILEAAGFSVTSADSQGQAIELLRANQFHLLILDLSLQAGDATNTEGMQFLEYVNQHGLLKNANVIMMSAYATKERLQKAFRDHRVVDFLDKYEFDMVEFINIVKKILTEDVPIKMESK